jgi:ribulose-5-phosphate 4-epimerase/fuculose-1-phosphate aldolase
VTIAAEHLSEASVAFVDRFALEAEHVFRTLRQGGTLTANGTLSFVQRIPDEEDRYVSVFDPGLWSFDGSFKVVVRDREGTILLGDGPSGDPFGFVEVLAQHPSLTTIAHVHSPHLGAFSQAQQSLRITYVPAQRATLARQLPVYIDRRQAHGHFILEQLAKDPDIPGILEGNGGASIWGRNGLIKTAQHIELLEEGARLQWLSAALGGPKEYGPGVLAEQWRMGGLLERAKSLGLVPTD